MNPVTARERKKKGGEASEMQKGKSMNDKEVSRNAVVRTSEGKQRTEGHGTS